MPAISIAMAITEIMMSFFRILTSKYELRLFLFSIPFTSAAQENSSAVRRLRNSIGTNRYSNRRRGWRTIPFRDVSIPFSFIASDIVKKSSFKDAKLRNITEMLRIIPLGSLHLSSAVVISDRFFCFLIAVPNIRKGIIL